MLVVHNNYCNPLVWFMICTYIIHANTNVVDSLLYQYHHIGVSTHTDTMINPSLILMMLI